MYIHYSHNKYHADLVYTISLCIFAPQIYIYKQKTYEKI